MTEKNNHKLIFRRKFFSLNKENITFKKLLNKTQMFKFGRSGLYNLNMLNLKLIETQNLNSFLFLFDFTHNFCLIKFIEKNKLF